MREQKGITLVALVITIIVLLILAGVGISMALSPDGIFNRAQEAVNEYSNKAQEEEDIINQYVNIIDEQFNAIQNPGNTTNDTTDDDTSGDETTT